MQYWYGYTGENLVMGSGRAIRQVVSSSQLSMLMEQVATFDEHHALPLQRRGTVDAASFNAALLAPLAVREGGTASPPATPFRSAGQVLRLFEGVPIAQAAANLFNGRIAGAYATEGSADTIAARVAQGFERGELLALPRDAARLQLRPVLDMLPGALVFLLSRETAERKAFAQYLRRGAAPNLSAAERKMTASLRPTLRTWEREARLTRELLAEGCPCTPCF